MEDGEILDLFFARSEEAIGALDAKYGKRCRGLSQRLLGCGEDAEECVNDAYLGLWNAIPPERPEKLSTYLLRVVRNISLTRRRSAAAQKRCAPCVALEELAECLPAPDSAESAVEVRELTALLERFLDGLAPLDRTVFLRRFWFAEPYEAIAGATGLSVKNVSVRLVRLRKRLRSFLEEMEVF